MTDVEPLADGQEQSPQQPNYDTTLKDIVKQNVREFIQVLLPGAEYEDTVNVELIRSTIRADKAFRMRYKGIRQILNIEFESGDGNIITFNFQVLPLFLQEAEHFVQNRVKCMYPLLPTMKGTNRTLIKQALDELAELYKEDQVTLAQQIIWMELLLERTDTISKEEKQNIRENLNMYDSLWEDNPKVKQMQAKAQAEGLRKGLEQGLVQGKVLGMHEAVLKVVKRRFPALAPEAEPTINQIRSYDALNLLMDQLLDAPNETIARFLLRLPAA